MSKIARKACAFAALTLVAIHTPAMAESPAREDEAKLIAFLDKETKPGLLTFGKYGRLAGWPVGRWQLCCECGLPPRASKSVG
jgi:hypothetical protein